MSHLLATVKKKGANDCQSNSDVTLISTGHATLVSAPGDYDGLA